MKFKDLLANEDILQAIENLGYTEPTEIQKEIIPSILEGYDVLGQSQTGTGKTLAFAAPILDKLNRTQKTQCLILAPTRELAIQIERDFEKITTNKECSFLCVYGSSRIDEQIKKLRNGVQVVIGTPGRVKDLINRKALKLSYTRFFVLDEADEMLSMGFTEELEYIFSCVPEEKQVLLFSATMPKSILNIAKKYMKTDYKSVSIKSKSSTADNIKQEYYEVSEKTRLESMCRVMDFYNSNRSIIFCRTKRNANTLYAELSKRGYSTNVIHGDITQEQRIATLDHFKAGDFNYLIATDVAARGIHVDDVEIVFNYNLPESNEAYVHRIGRTGRASKSGLAVTFIKNNEIGLLKGIEKHISYTLTKKEIPSADEILNSRVTKVIDNSRLYEIDQLPDSKFNNYLEQLDKLALQNICNHLLNEKLMTNIGSNFKINLQEQSNKKANKRNINNEDIRVFINMGKLDNIDKRSLLSLIEKTAGVNEGTCYNLEILSKFSFMNIKKDKYDIVIRKCNGLKINKRKVNIEKVKN